MGIGNKFQYAGAPIANAVRRMTIGIGIFSSRLDMATHLYSGHRQNYGSGITRRLISAVAAANSSRDMRSLCAAVP